MFLTPQPAERRAGLGAWAGAESCHGFPLVVQSSNFGPNFPLTKRDADKMGSLWEVVQVK